MNRRELTKDITAAGTLEGVPALLSAQDGSSLPFHFIGLGGAGCNALETIFAKEVAGHFTGISDPTRPALPPGVHFIPFVPAVKKSATTTNYLPDDEYTLPLAENMLTVLSQPHHFVLLTGLGGYTGTRLLKSFTQQLQQQQQPFTIIASLPFSWETDRQKAVEALLPAYQSLPQFHTFNLNELAAKNKHRQLNMKEFMQLANEQLYTIFLQAC